MATIDFYFEFSSPYGYIASERIADLAARHGRTVDWHPFLLGIVFKKEGTQSLVSYPMKGPYSKRDIERSAAYHDIPFQWPPVFPVYTVNAARAALWARRETPDRAVALIQAIYRKAFAAGEDIGHVGSVLDAAENVGLDREAVEAAVKSPDMKALLKDETQAAIDRGVFGSPFCFIDGEPFWGADRFEMMDAWLTRGGW
jgi:2-hydroxychromene-2-carboxylate isomerase